MGLCRGNLGDFMQHWVLLEVLVELGCLFPMGNRT